MLTRVLSAAVLAPLVIAAVYFGGLAFYLMILLAAGISIYEWTRMVEPGCKAPVLVTAIFAVLAPVAASDPFGFHAALIAAIALTLTVGILARYGAGAAHAMRLAFGVFYMNVAFITTLWLRSLENGGLFAILILFVFIWATDIMAYFSGKSIGGPKLAPKISPKKTWAGLIGGMVGSAAFGSGLTLWAMDNPEILPLIPGFGDMPIWCVAVTGLVLAVVGQAGDLFISLIKRHYGLKDTGNLIPGHGGILDRIDGLLLAGPVFAALVLLVEGSGVVVTGGHFEWN